MAVDITLTPARLLLVLATVLLAGFAGQWIFKKTRVPDTLLLMGVGFVIGWLFDIDSGPFLAVMPFVGVLALIVILFDGGQDLKLNDLVKGLPRASVLSFLGFLLSVLAVTLYGHYVLALAWLKAALLGAILGGTSAVIVMPMLPGLNLGKKAETLLGLESALTDVLAVVVALALATMISQGAASPLFLVRNLVSSFAIALLVGLAVGMLWLAFLDKIRATGNEGIWTVAAILALFAIVEELGASGPIAVLIFGIILGNATKITKTFKMAPRRVSYTMDRMQDNMVFFVRSYFFVFLGIVFDPAFLSISGSAAAPGAVGNATNATANLTENLTVAGGGSFFTSPLVLSLGIVVVLIIARIGAVAIATINDRKLIEHRVRFVLLMPRGLAAAVLAAIPAAAPYNIRGVEAFLSYAFATLLFTNLLAMFAGLIGGDTSKFSASRVGTRAKRKQEGEDDDEVDKALRKAGKANKDEPSVDGNNKRSR